MNRYLINLFASILFVISIFYPVSNSQITDELPPPHLVMDINQHNSYFLSAYGSMAELNGTMYLSGWDGLHGGQLWKSDGTESGTIMVTDSLPDSENYRPEYFQSFSPYLYFTIGKNLMRSDGTQDGTILLASSIEINGWRWVEYKGKVFFLAWSIAENSYTLWETDGTPENTRIVFSFGAYPPYYPIGIYDDPGLVVFQEMLYFSAPGPAGNEVWKSDGTSEGTSLLFDIAPGNISSNPGYYTAVGSNLFFVAAVSGFQGNELWVTQGTPESTVMVKEINFAPHQSTFYTVPQFIVIDQTIYFLATDAEHGAELWSSQGTEQTTQVVADILPGADSSIPNQLTLLNGKIYFLALTKAVGGEYALWRFDPVTQTSELVFDPTALGFAPYPLALMAWNDHLYFGLSRPDGVAAEKFWIFSSNGEPGDYKAIAPLVAYEFFPFGGALYMAANNQYQGIELWKTDGTSQNTVLVGDFNRQPDFGYENQGDHYPTDVFSTRDRLYFAPDEGAYDKRIWISDGNSSGTAPLLSWQQGAFCYQGIQSALGLIFYKGPNCELWRTDGTEDRTWQVSNIVNGGYNFPSGFTSFQARLFYFTYPPQNIITSDYPIQLWSTDGGLNVSTLVKTLVPKPIYPNPLNVIVSPMTLANNKLYFFTKDDSTYSSSPVEKSWWKLWVSDGTETGTRVIFTSTVNDTNFVARVGTIYSANGLIFFSATNSDGKEALWESDGTTAGTREIQPGTSITAPLWMTNFRDQACFINYTAPGYQPGMLKLYCTKGSAYGGIIEKATVRSDFGGGQYSPLIVAGGKIYFSSRTNIYSSGELWVSDGTSAGTHPVGVNNGSYKNLQDLSSIGPRIFFTAEDDEHGRELWTSNGTADGTYGMDINPGVGSSNPKFITWANEKVLFFANDGTHGPELWGIDFDYLPYDLFLPAIQR